MPCSDPAKQRHKHIIGNRVALVGEDSVSGITAEPPPGQSGAPTHARLYHLQRRNHDVPRSARRSRASMRSARSLPASSGSWKRLSVCWHATAKAGRQKRRFRPGLRPPQRSRLLQRGTAGALRPRNQTVGKRASPTLGEQVLALADGKTQEEITAACRGRARTMSAASLPGTSEPAASNCATEALRHAVGEDGATRRGQPSFSRN
jgi:hypothetical protein